MRHKGSSLMCFKILKKNKIFRMKEKLDNGFSEW